MTITALGDMITSRNTCNQQGSMEWPTCSRLIHSGVITSINDGLKANWVRQIKGRSFKDGLKLKTILRLMSQNHSTYYYYGLSSFALQLLWYGIDGMPPDHFIATVIIM